MSNTIKVLIDGGAGAVDFGPLGEGIVTTLTLTPSGPGVNGSARVALRKAAGGYATTLLDHAHVQIMETNAAGTVIVRRLFGGFIDGRKMRGVLGTNLKDWDLDCVDYNVLLDQLVGGASIEGTPETITLAADTFAAQVADLWDQLQAFGGTPAAGIDATTYVADLYATMPAVSFLGMTGREMMQALCNTAQALDDTLRPRFFMGYDETFGNSGFGPPCVNVYDAALTPAASLTISDVGPYSGSVRPWYEYENSLDGTRLANWRQGTYAGGGVVVATVSTTSADNPFSGHGGWADKPVALDTGDATEAQAEIDRITAQTANVRQTVRGTTDAWVAPGAIVDVTWALDGFSAEGLRNNGTEVAYLPTPTPTDAARYTVDLGQRKLWLGEEGEEGIDAAPIDSDAIPPIPPNSPALVSNHWVGGEGGGRARIVCSVTNSVSADVAEQRLQLVYNGTARYSDWVAAGGPSPATLTFPYVEVLPGATVTAFAQARDSNGNTSDFGAGGTPFVAARQIQPKPDPFDHQTPDNSDAAAIAGWYQSAITGACTASRNTTTVYWGKVSLQLNVTSTVADLIEYSGARVAVQPGEIWIVWVARRANSATGTAATLYRIYDSADTLLTTVTPWSATPTTGWVEASGSQQEVAIPPRGTYGTDAVYMVPVFKYTSTGTAAGCLFSIDVDRWHAKARIPQIDLRPSSGVPLNKKDASTGDIREQEFYSAGNYIRQGVATGGTEVGERLLNSRGQGLRIPPDTDSSGEVTLASEGALSVSGGGGVAALALNSTNGFVATGRQQWISVVKSSTFTADVAYTRYLCSGTITANLPTAASITGAMYEIVNTGTGKLTIDGNSSETIGGRTTWLLDRDASITIVSDGTNWQVVCGHNHNRGSTLPSTGLFSGLTYEYLINGSVVLVRYDGTRWLGPEHIVAEHNYIGGPPFSATSEVLATSLRNDLALYLTRFTVSYYTGGGVDGSNYWRLYLRRLNSGIGFDNVVYIQTTDNNWFKEPDKTSADMSNNPCATTDIWLQLYAEKTGSPNSIYIQAQTHGCYVYT